MKVPPKSPATCAQCGAAFKTYAYKLRDGEGRFCSNHCRVEASRKPDPKGYSMRHGRREHMLIAERALGKPLPRQACVHHANENIHDNRPANLVICQDNRYHKLLHYRLRIRAAGGDPNLHRICTVCHQLKVPAEMVRSAHQVSGYATDCLACHRRTENARRSKAAFDYFCQEENEL